MSQKKNFRKCKSFRSALGKTLTCDLLIRSQNEYVYSYLWLLRHRLSKPSSHSSCSQLFTWVTAKSLSKTVAFDLTYDS